MEYHSQPESQQRADAVLEHGAEGSHLLHQAAVKTTHATSASGARRRPAQVPAREVVREFYDWYMHAHNPEPKGRNLAKFRKYVTQRFLRQAMAPDNDAIEFLGSTQNPDDR